MSVKEMRDELRALRKEHMKPVSKMGKGDISAEIQRLKVGVEETPAAALMKGKAAAKETAPLGTVKDDIFAYEEGTKKGMPRKTARKAYEPKKKAEEAEPKKVEEAPKKAKAPKAPPKKAEASKAPEEAPKKKIRFAKGSEEAKEHMRKIREMRKKKE